MGTGMHLASHSIESGALLFSVIDLMQYHCVQINKMDKYMQVNITLNFNLIYDLT